MMGGSARLMVGLPLLLRVRMLLPGPADTAAAAELTEDEVARLFGCCCCCAATAIDGRGTY